MQAIREETQALHAVTGPEESEKMRRALVALTEADQRRPIGEFIAIINAALGVPDEHR
jgi:hypothetical protein